MVRVPDVSFQTAALVAVVARLAVMAFGLWQDANMPVKYTDIDYQVFTDAARYVATGESPYLRQSYRYTPLLAWMLAPGEFLGCPAAFGKLLFIAADVVVGYVAWKMLVLRGVPAKAATKLSLMWLWNPLVVNVSTRGNAESLLAVLVLGSLLALYQKKVVLSAVLYGISVHLKIYPIVYAPAFLLCMDTQRFEGRVQSSFRSGEGVCVRAFRWSVHWLNYSRIKFALVSAGLFFGLTGAMYVIYGQEFLYETYLYHVVRKDNRHNLSLFFYQLYLSYGYSSSAFDALAAFLPQLGLVTLTAVALAPNDIIVAVFAQTLAFVAFNKVMTVQYFLWWMPFLPVVAPILNISLRRTLLVAAIFALTLGVWMFNGYKVEFLGEDAFWGLFCSGIAFFAANILMFWCVVKARPSFHDFHAGFLSAIDGFTISKSTPSTDAPEDKKHQ